MSKKYPFVKSETKMDGTITYKFQIYIGVDQLTGRKKYTTRRGFKTEKAASLEYTRIKTAIDEGEYKEKSYHNFNEVYLTWLDTYELTVKESTFNKNIEQFNIHVLPIFKESRIEMIRTVHIQEAVNKWSRKLTRHRNLFYLLRKLLKFAISMEYIDKNPCDNVVLPADGIKNKSDDGSEDEKDNFYDKNQLKIFLDAAYAYEFRKFILFRLLSFGGIRSDEALALRWKYIDFKRNEIKINHTVTLGKARRVYIGTPKTPKSNRIISIDKKTMSYLKQYKKEQLNEVDSPDKIPTQLLFSNLKGEISHPNTVKTWLNEIYRHSDEMIRISPHGFRHTHASLLFEALAMNTDNGHMINFKYVQERLDHEKLETTLEVYTHVSKRIKDINAEKLSDYLSNF